MFDINNTGGKKRTTVPFPVSTAVDNVVLHSVEPNKHISAVKFMFKRINDSDDTISFLTDSLLPPKLEYCNNNRLKEDGTTETAQEEYDRLMKQYMGYIRHIATSCGVSQATMNTIPAVQTFDEFVEKYCEVVNTKKTNDPVYLKVVKDKNGYSKLPKYRGKGVIQPMIDGKPDFQYTSYELDLIEASGLTGVAEEEDDTKLSISSIDDI